MVPILNTTYDTVNSFLKPTIDKELGNTSRKSHSCQFVSFKTHLFV